MDVLWSSHLSLPDLMAVFGFLVALVGLGMNTFQVRLLVRQIRLDALVRIADSSRRFPSIVIAIERPELWEAMQIAEPRSGHDGFRRDRFIGLCGKGCFRISHASSRRRAGRRKRMQKARCLRPDADAL